MECLLLFEEETHKPGDPYSWESIDQVTANFTPDVTPLILAGKINLCLDHMFILEVFCTFVLVVPRFSKTLVLLVGGTSSTTR